MGLLWKRNPSLKTASGNLHVFKGREGKVICIAFLVCSLISRSDPSLQAPRTQGQIPQTAIPSNLPLLTNKAKLPPTPKKSGTTTYIYIWKSWYKLIFLLTALLRSEGHTVEFKKTRDRDDVELVVHGEIIYRCKIQDLQYGKFRRLLTQQI